MGVYEAVRESGCSEERSKANAKGGAGEECDDVKGEHMVYYFIWESISLRVGGGNRDRLKAAQI